MEAIQPQLFMVHPDLFALSELNLSDGYTVRRFHHGDESSWEHIIKESFQNEPNFDKDMKSDSSYLPERVWFICDENGPIATASAWYRPDWDENTGYLHMVGILPSHAGKGLGLQVSLAALHHMQRENRTKAVLHTDDFRIPAVKIYWKLGFKPKIIHENQIKRWKALEEILDLSSK